MGSTKYIRYAITGLLSIVVLAAIIYSIVWLAHYKTNFPVPDNRSSRDFTTVLLDQEPQLFDSKNRPIFTISHIDHVQKNWYIITIKATNSQSNIASKLIINDPYFSSSYMNVVAGPETTFSSDELTREDLPVKVIQEALK